MISNSIWKLLNAFSSYKAKNTVSNSRPYLYTRNGSPKKSREWPCGSANSLSYESDIASISQVNQTAFGWNGPGEYISIHRGAEPYRFLCGGYWVFEVITEKPSFVKNSPKKQDVFSFLYGFRLFILFFAVPIISQRNGEVCHILEVFQKNIWLAVLLTWPYGAIACHPIR